MTWNPIAAPVLLVGVFALLGVFVAWRLWESRERKGEWQRWGVRLVAVVLLLLMSLRPGLDDQPSAAAAKNMDVFFALDQTASITAEDYDGGKPRLEGVIHDITRITSALAGAHFSLITFSGTANLTLPLTSDSMALLSIVSVTEPDLSINSRGTSIDEPFALLKKQLEQHKKTKKDRTRIVFFLTDGEQNNGKDPKSFKELASLIDGGAVLGYGTEKGGKMKNPDRRLYDALSESAKASFKPPPEYINESRAGTGNDAISKIDEGNLKALADDMGIRYEHRTSPDNLDAALSSARSSVSTFDKTDRSPRELYWWGAIALLVICGWELWSVSRRASELIRLRGALR